MVEDVMSHFMGHHRSNFWKCALLEEIVTERNPCGPEQPSDISAYACGLTRGIHLKNLVHRNFICLSHRKNRVSNFWIGYRLIGVKERFDINWRDKDDDPRKGNCHESRPNPPGTLCMPEDGIENNDQQRCPYQSYCKTD